MAEGLGGSREEFTAPSRAVGGMKMARTPMTDEELVKYVRSRYPMGPRGENGLLHDLADRIERLNGQRKERYHGLGKILESESS